MRKLVEIKEVLNKLSTSFSLAFLIYLVWIIYDFTHYSSVLSMINSIVIFLTNSFDGVYSKLLTIILLAIKMIGLLCLYNKYLNTTLSILIVLATFSAVLFLVDTPISCGCLALSREYLSHGFTFFAYSLIIILIISHIKYENPS